MYLSSSPESCTTFQPECTIFMFLPTQSSQEEIDNKFLIQTILKKRPKERDLPALRFLFEEAMHKGFAHRQLPNAASILEWGSSRAELVVGDQAAAHATGKCSRKGSGCPRGTFSLFGGCEVAACVHVPMEVDGLSTPAKKEALERNVPALSDASDLRHFRKLAKAMAKERKKLSTHR